MSDIEKLKKLKQILELTEDPTGKLLELTERVEKDEIENSNDHQDIRDEVEVKIKEVAQAVEDIELLEAEKGERGERGERGEQGIKGDKGDAGRDGKDGLDGIDGNDGEQGLQGEIGAPGDPGEDGLMGPRPEHEWKGTKLRFETRDGKWGRWTDLRGKSGGGTTLIGNNANYWVRNGDNLTTRNTLDSVTLGGTLTVPRTQFDIAATPIANAEGLVQWNADDGTLDVGLPGGVSGQMFHEQFFDGKNATGADIADGVPVMFAAPVGASGKVEFQEAIADGSLSSEYIMGLTTEPIANGEFGKITSFGKIRGIDTTGTPYGETWANGDLIYVGMTAGSLTNVAPNAPGQRILVATVIIAHTNGTLLARPTWNPKLTELDDVNGTALTTTGQVLTWNQSNEYWDPSSKIFLDDVNGRVGIGTSTPSVELEVDGESYFSGSVGIGVAPSSAYRLYNSANGTTIQTALVNSCVYSGTGQEATGSFNQVYSVGTHAAARGIGGRFAVIDYKLDRTSGSSTVYGGWFSTADRTGTFQAGASHSFQAGFFNVNNATGDWTTNNPTVNTYNLYIGNTPTGYGSNHTHYSIYAPSGNNYFGGTLGIGGVDSSYKLYVNGTSNFTGVARFASDAYFGDDFKIHNTIVSGIEVMDVQPQTTQSMALRVIPGSSPSYSWAGETTASFLEFHKDSAGARRLMILAPTDTAAGYDIMTYGTTTPGPINFGYIVSSVKYDILSVTQDGIVANGTSILNGDVGINLLSGTSPGKALDIKGQLAFTVVAIPTTACTYTLSGTAGNVDDGVHRYKVSYYNAEGETGLSSVYLEATVVDKSTSGQVLLADIPVSPDPTVIGRRIYRGKAGGSTSSYYFLVDINDNTTTTYTDNTADAGLAAADSRNRDNFTAGAIYKNGSRYGFIGTNNFAMGLLSMSPTSDPTGYFNFALGGYALNNITSGSLNTAVGFYSLLNLETASNCVSVGSYSQYSNVSGYDNVSIGSSALRSVVSTKRNVAIGSNALYSTVTNYNVGIGFESGYSVNTGSGVVAMGYQALRSGTVCTGTVALGYVAGYSAAGLTANACTTTTNSVFIGMYSGLGSTTQRTNAIAIGYKAVVDADNTCVIGGAGADAVDILLTKNIYDRSDTYKIYFGAGDDMSIDYDGTQGNIKTDLVAPSDLHVDCGTDKTIVLDETVWDDLRTPISTAKAIPGKEPKEVAYKGGIVYEFEDGRDEGCAFNVQLPHDYKEGSDIEFHIHMLIRTSGAGIGAENVKWDFTHSWSNIGDAQPTETTVPATIDVQNDTEDTHYLKEITATITGTGKKISSMLICSLTRDVSVANNYTDDVLVMEVDFHYQIDTIGSRQEDSK